LLTGSARAYVVRPDILPGLPPTHPDSSLDLHWSARACELALRADYGTSPNPMVGAVIVDSSGNVAGEGFHLGAGQPHAEQEALMVAGDQALGGTLYVNLEPCATHRTPSCGDAIIEAGLKRVVISMLDPDERVRGAGLAKLRAAGVEVVLGVHEERALRLNEFYAKHRLTGRPFVSAKFAMSLDGKIATRTGESRWITGDEARVHGHRLRHIHDAILVGVNTAIADDPELTTRLEGIEGRQPLRVVLDSQLRLRMSARVVGANTLIATTRAGRMGAAEVMKFPATANGQVALAPLLDELGARGILSLLVEGGSAVHASFMSQGLVDKVYAYIAPRLIGGREAPGPLGGAGVERLAEAIPLRELDATRLGSDLLVTGYVDVHRNS
jgi:diaminohydroxyphosphoribosylaminopyrimidine deaminase/5-amino-6-(5-phosphoribosylamino)uracil reductase